MIKIKDSQIEMEIIPDESPDTSYLEQEGFEDRLAEYQRGEFGFLGVRAVVIVPIPHGRDVIDHKFESPGLWGIESDSEQSYLEEVFEEEKGVLKDLLQELNVEVA